MYLCPPKWSGEYLPVDTGRSTQRLMSWGGLFAARPEFVMPEYGYAGGLAVHLRHSAASSAVPPPMLWYIGSSIGWPSVLRRALDQSLAPQKVWSGASLRWTGSKSDWHCTGSR
eukprot:CAMPEP_0194508830 /NCGR_PEP_ID=MMETSP0253-20130528/39138_1 /TAXON_ID=2966 /ORGANISM="Noctiluca scintillans" /LENGTH=113 /DNA_ID=CAMNT_0039351901 /DNA_START=68 /DNA_END=409 /DNA_ORIENTATION=-